MPALSTKRINKPRQMLHFHPQKKALILEQRNTDLMFTLNVYLGLILQVTIKPAILRHFFRSSGVDVVKLLS